MRNVYGVNVNDKCNIIMCDITGKQLSISSKEQRFWKSFHRTTLSATQDCVWKFKSAALQMLSFGFLQKNFAAFSYIIMIFFKSNHFTRWCVLFKYQIMRFKISLLTFNKQSGGDLKCAFEALTKNHQHFILIICPSRMVGF